MKDIGRIALAIAKLRHLQFDGRPNYDVELLEEDILFFKKIMVKATKKSNHIHQWVRFAEDMGWFCNKCGKEKEPDGSDSPEYVCPKCGTPMDEVSIVCPKCVKFCKPELKVNKKI